MFTFKKKIKVHNCREERRALTSLPLYTLQVFKRKAEMLHNYFFIVNCIYWNYYSFFPLCWLSAVECGWWIWCVFWWRHGWQVTNNKGFLNLPPDLTEISTTTMTVDSFTHFKSVTYWWQWCVWWSFLCTLFPMFPNCCLQIIKKNSVFQERPMEWSLSQSSCLSIKVSHFLSAVCFLYLFIRKNIAFTL
jgi:hypothetical protein